MKIMIVDDHADMRRMIRNVISLSLRESAEIYECESGEEAVTQFSIQKPNCILMDIQLTNMTGLEAAKEIFQQDPEVYIVMVTGHDSAAFREKAKALSILNFISKDNLSKIGPLLISLSQ